MLGIWDETLLVGVVVAADAVSSRFREAWVELQLLTLAAIAITIKGIIYFLFVFIILSLCYFINFSVARIKSA
jgi:hypothetical protein